MEVYFYGATVNGGNGKWKRKTETENGKGKWSSQQYVHSTSYQCQDRSSSSKSRSASLGRCKTWTLDWTHELTDIWTPDKAINDDMTHMQGVVTAIYPVLPAATAIKVFDR